MEKRADLLPWHAKSPWLKVLNPSYSQKNGRHEMFDGFRQRRA
jgi:hypothetical protein